MSEETEPRPVIMDEVATDLSRKLLDYSLDRVMAGDNSSAVEPSWTITFEDLSSCHLIALSSLDKLFKFTPDQKFALTTYTNAAFDIMQATILYRRSLASELESKPE